MNINETTSLSESTINSLSDAGICTIEQLSECTIESLYKIRNLGKNALEEVYKALFEAGYSLKDDRESGVYRSRKSVLHTMELGSNENVVIKSQNNSMVIPIVVLEEFLKEVNKNKEKQ